MKSNSKRPLIAARRAEAVVNEIMMIVDGTTIGFYRDLLEDLVLKALVADRAAQRCRRSHKDSRGVVGKARHPGAARLTEWCPLCKKLVPPGHRARVDHPKRRGRP